MIVIRNSATGELQVVASATGYGEDWAVVADPAPEAPFIWDAVAEALVPDLATARAAQRALIQKARDRAMMDNVTVADQPTEGDAAEFQLRSSTPDGKDGYDFITGFVLSAKDALRWEESYSEPFKLADNRTVLFSAAQWVTIGAVIKSEMQARFARGEVLLGRIDAAETLAAIRAVVWSLEDPA